VSSAHDWSIGQPTTQSNPRGLRICEFALPYGGRVSYWGNLLYGYGENKEQILGRLGRVEGQVRGLARMVVEDAYCIDILTQIAAANSALKKVAMGLLEDHLRHCIAEGTEASGREREAKVVEASAAIDRLFKA
jgi:CsoR family transcriptional regulator, copper-sensing transcriptional repressor